MIEDYTVKSAKPAESVVTTLNGWTTNQQWGDLPQAPLVPSEEELRLREAAIALTIEYFKGIDDVEFEKFDAQLVKFHNFLQTGVLPTAVTNPGTGNVTF